MIELLLIADDLTGAIDTGVQFASRGLDTLVSLDLEPDFASMETEPRVIAVDTESRHLDAGEAASRVGAVVKWSREQGITHLYKKTDSTLRGNLGAELESTLKKSGQRILPFIPALPKSGRYTRQGIHYIEERPLHLTPFGADPLEPIKSSKVSDILAEQTSLRSAVVDPVGTSLRKILSDNKADLLIFDCQNSSELKTIGKILREFDLLAVTAGSAGFAELLPELMGLSGGMMPPVQPRGPLLVVNGSLNHTSLAQVEYAVKRGTQFLAIPSDILSAPTDRAASAATKIAENLRVGRDAILGSLPLGSEPDNLFPEKSTGEKRRELCLRAADNLGLVTAAILENSNFGSLAVFGGDTLAGVVNALGVHRVIPVSESAPGMVLSRLDGNRNDLLLFSKAGGFGRKDTIINLIEQTKGN